MQMEKTHVSLDAFIFAVETLAMNLPALYKAKGIIDIALDIAEHSNNIVNILSERKRDENLPFKRLQAKIYLNMASIHFEEAFFK